MTFVWRPGRAPRSPSVLAPAADLTKGETELEPLGRTGVWFRTLVLPRRTRTMYAFSPHPVPTPENGRDWTEYFRSLVADPYNPSQLTFAKDPDDPKDVAVTVSVLALPGAPAQPWSRPRDPVRWTVDHVRRRGRSIPGSRSVWVLTPPGFDARRRSYNLIVAFDGLTYLSTVPTPTVVQNLVAAGRLTPSVVVLVGNAPGARNVELLHHPGFVRFLAADLLPWLRRRYGLKTAPERTVLVGSSLGGLTAVFAALVHPELFGNVLAQSGAFTWSRTGGTLGSPTLMEEFARAPARATKFYLDAGTLETAVFPGTQMSLLAGVRHLRDVLRAKGYPVTYAEFEGGHDYACWGGTLADGLIDLLGDRRRSGSRGRKRAGARA